MGLLWLVVVVRLLFVGTVWRFAVGEEEERGTDTDTIKGDAVMVVGLLLVGVSVVVAAVTVVVMAA